MLRASLLNHWNWCVLAHYRFVGTTPVTSFCHALVTSTTLRCDSVVLWSRVLHYGATRGGCSVMLWSRAPHYEATRGGNSVVRWSRAPHYDVTLSCYGHVHHITMWLCRAVVTCTTLRCDSVVLWSRAPHYDATLSCGGHVHHITKRLLAATLHPQQHCRQKCAVRFTFLTFKTSTYQ